MRAIAIPIFLLSLSTSAFARPNDYGKLRKQFAQLCASLKEDGRSDLIAKLLEPRLPKDYSCPDCRPLFIQFFAPCKPPPPPKEKLVTPAPVADVASEIKVASSEPAHPSASESLEAASQIVPIPPQRYPQLAVLDVVSEISRQLAEDSRSPEQTRQAVDQLVAILTSNSLTPGERDYLTTVASYFLGGFESDVGTAPSKQKPSTKGLFSEEEDTAEPAEGSNAKPLRAASAPHNDEGSIDGENAPRAFR